MSRFREAMAQNDSFVLTCELVPGRGFRGKGVDQVLKFAEAVVSMPEVHALTITDNAGGNPALSADVLGTEVVAMGVDLVVHLSCKDMNRNAIESRAYALQRFGITNLLVITGDYPFEGYLGLGKPVFDVDAVTALHYLSEMNDGLEVPQGRKNVQLSPTDFFLGAAVSPFKWTEGSCQMQYLKMEKKIDAGADYFITQLGFDSRKSRELIQFMKSRELSRVPVIGSVYLLSGGAARHMNGGNIPGCYVTDEFTARVAAESKADDKGKAARLERAARQITIMKGLGYKGAHIEGLNLKSADVQRICERVPEIEQNWPDYLAEFDSAPQNPYYYFDRGEEFTADSEPGTVRRLRRPRIFSPVFWMTRVLHRMVFEADAPFAGFMKWFSKFIEHKKFFYKSFSAAEQLTKQALFSCRHCDDCALFELFYVCPESQCPKGMRIGPCGGARVDGHCEVFPEKYCLWERVYRRARNRRECENLRFIIPPRDWKLYNTNSWVNYFLKKDHSGKKIKLPVRDGGNRT
jgi:methylenetetrahydrofolate reductase (NADPH)